MKRFYFKIKKFFILTKSEQRGVVVLLTILLLLILINILLPRFLPQRHYDCSVLKSDIKRFEDAKTYLEDSINIVKLQNSGKLDYELAKSKLKPFPFDPNKLPEVLWLKMGFTKRQVKVIKRYEAKGGKFRKKEDLKKIYAISDVEYSILEPYIKIKDNFISESEISFNKKRSRKAVNTKNKRIFKNTELNSCDSLSLIKNLGFTPWLASRTVKYRNLLGGFYCKNQIKEVYGMKSAIYKKIEKYLKVDTSLIKKIDVNNASFKTIIRHPYIDYSLTIKMIKGRKRNGGYNTMQEIKTDLGITDTIFRKIKHYLYIRPQKN